MKPAPWIKHDAGRGRAFNAHRNSLQGPCVNAARLIQKQRLDSVTGRNASCGRINDSAPSREVAVGSWQAKPGADRPVADCECLPF